MKILFLNKYNFFSLITSNRKIMHIKTTHESGIAGPAINPKGIIHKRKVKKSLLYD